MKHTFYKIFSSLLICTTFFLLHTDSAHAATYYLDSVLGSDANNGTSTGTPWQSLDPLRSTSLQPGDVVSFKRGSSWDTGYQFGNLNTNLGLEINASGTSGNPITFTAYGTGANPLFSNSYSAIIYTRAITVAGDYISISNLTLQNTKEACLYLTTTADSVTVNAIDASGCAYGVVMAGTNSTLSGSTLHDATMLVNTVGGTDDSGALGILLSGSNNTITGNTIENNTAASYDFGTDGGAIELYAQGITVQNNLITKNIIRGNDMVTEVGGSSSPTFTNNTFAYNLLENNSRLAVVHLDGGFGATTTGLHFHHNTISEVASEWTGIQANRSATQLIWFSAAPASNTMSLTNNIIHLNGFTSVASHDSFTHTYNLYYLLGGTTIYTLGSNESTGNPLFTSLSAPKNFALQSGSPAINVGTTQSYTTDLIGTAVPQGAAEDFGAYEFIVASPTPTPSPSPSPTPTPTPTPSPTSNSGSQSGAGAPGTSAPSTPTCTDFAPSGVPDLFQINRRGSEAQLYFTPVLGTTTGYHVVFGFQNGDERFGGLSLAVNDHTNLGVQSITIKDLNPRQNYSFKVVPTNGCSVGTWSNWLSAKGASSTKKWWMFYRW